MPTKKKAKKAKTKAKLAKKKPAKRRATTKTNHLRQSKTADFLEKIRENNTMIDYMTRLRVLNPPAAALMSKDDPTAPRREGGFVRLAHANEEFTAPVLTKGKSVASATKIVDNKGEGEE